jgi:hypothetical protein
MNWFNNFNGGFNNNFGRTSYGGGNPGWGGSYGGGGNYGAVQASYNGNAQTLSNLNTQSTMNTTGTSFMSNNNSGGWGNAGGFGFNTGWGNRSNESGRYYDYPSQPQPQPYDNFLINGFKYGYAQDKVVATRDRRRVAEAAIDNIGKVGFWGRGSDYPLSLYNV